MQSLVVSLRWNSVLYRCKVVVKYGCFPINAAGAIFGAKTTNKSILQK